MKTQKQLYQFVLLCIIMLGVKNNYAQAPAIQWQKSYGGSAIDGANALKQTTDGYIIAGASNSMDGDVTSNFGLYDTWIIKTDINGTIQWQKSYGDTGYDVANDIQQTTDGGYIIAGYADSTGNNGGHGLRDYWIVKIDALGTLQWQKCYGGKKQDQAQVIRQTPDGGYIVAGSSNSNDGDVNGNHSLGSNYDYWILKIDQAGSIQWQKCLGGLNNDDAYDIQLTADHGFIVAGISASNGGNVTFNHGYNDYWVVKLDSLGNLQWQKTYGGSGSDVANSIQQTNDGGYIIAGYTNSNDDDVSGNHQTSTNATFDIWIIKLDGIGGIQWEKCYGGWSDETAYSIKQTSEGGYVVAGLNNYNGGDITGSHGGGDFWIVKLDTQGIIQWENCYGGSSSDYPHGLEQTTDGGYIIAGASKSIDGDVTGNHGDSDYWVVKLGNATPVKEITKENNFLISPNPCSASIEIKFEDLRDEAELKITDLLGNLVKQKNNLSEITTVDLSSLQNGIYFVSVKTKDGVLTKKIIVQR
jgi:hypothetical protein